MDKKFHEFQELVSKKMKVFFDELGDNLKLAKDIAEVKVSMELLEAKQNRLFQEYGKAVFLSGQCFGQDTERLVAEISDIEQELQKKYLQLQKLKASL